MKRDRQECRYCGEQICRHGGCYCDDNRCADCARRRELERDADREAVFQRDVAGPLLGLTEDDEDWPGSYRSIGTGGWR